MNAENELPSVQTRLEDILDTVTPLPDFHTDDNFKNDTDVSGSLLLQPINGIRIFICLFGVLGNLIVISMILLPTEFKKGVTYWYILQLAIADSVFLLTVPFQIVEDVQNQWIFTDEMCKAKEAILFINYYSSIAFLMVMAMDRYIAICHAFSDRLQKLRKHKAAYIITAVVWTISLLICVPIMIFSTKRGQKPYCKCELQFPDPPVSAHDICIAEGFLPGRNDAVITYEECLEMYIIGEESPACTAPLDYGSGYSGDYDESSDSSVDTLHAGCHYINYNKGFVGFMYFNFIVMFILPFIVIAACYILIILYLRKTRFRRESPNGTRKTRDDKDTDRVIIMCSTLVIVFGVCWVPYHSVQMAKMKGIYGTKDFCSKLLKGATLMAYLNSAINPYIYFIGARFRNQLGRMKESKPFSAVMSFFGKATKSDSARSVKGPRHTNGDERTNARVEEAN